MTDIKPGQVWRRKSDGVETTVTNVNPWYRVGVVVHQAKRLTHTETRNFLRKYEFVREGS